MWNKKLFSRWGTRTLPPEPHQVCKILPPILIFPVTFAYLIHKLRHYWHSGGASWFLLAGLREAQPCLNCVYSVVSRPGGGTHCPINEKFDTGSGPFPRAKFHFYRGRNVGIQPPKLSKFWILAINSPLRSDSFAQFLRNSQHLYVSIGSF